MKLFDELFGRQKKDRKRAPSSQKAGAVEDRPEEEPLPEAEQRPEAGALSSETEIPKQVGTPRELAAQLPAMSGSLLELWKLLRDGEEPPVRSLAKGIDPDRLPLTGEELEAEGERLSERMESAAQERWERLSRQEAGEENTGLDARCCCWVSENRMAAWGLIFPPVGEGRELTREAVTAALKEAGVSFGVEPEQLTALVSSCLEPVPVAFGTPPSPGSDGWVAEHFLRKIDRTILIQEDGTVDYRAQKYVQNVMEGDVICDIIPPIPGLSGKRVDGEEVPPEKVHPAVLPRGRNVNISSDGRQLVAGETGHVVYTESNFNVMKVLEIDGDVDYNNGNVDFPGDIHIHGDVRDGFHIQAQGTILVDGLVEGARLDAGADILIAQGVVGDERALIRCKGNLHAKFLENCQVYTGGSIYTECTVASQLNSDEEICADAGRGSIIGGRLVAGQGIRARSIGARSGRTTVLKLGTATFVKQEADELRSQLKALETDRKRAAEDRSYLESLPIDQSKDGRLAKARVRCSALELKGQKLTRRLERLESSTPDLARCFVACDTMYPVTKLSICEQSRTIEAVWEKFRAGYDLERHEIKIYTP